MTTSEGPKLFTNKPKKSQLKQSKDFASPPSSTMASKPSVAAPTPPTPPLPPKESFARRYKFVWPLLLAVNFSAGAYLFMRTKKKDTGEVVDEAAASVPSTIVSTVPSQTSQVTQVTEDSIPPPPKAEPLKVREPIPEAQQREIFKWILEEKRKVKTKDPQEKKRIDEEKSLLKQIIRAKSIPSI